MVKAGFGCDLGIDQAQAVVVIDEAILNGQTASPAGPTLPAFSHRFSIVDRCFKGIDLGFPIS